MPDCANHAEERDEALREELIEGAMAAADRWLSKRSDRRLSEVNQRRLAGQVVNAVWERVAEAVDELRGQIGVANDTAEELCRTANELQAELNRTHAELRSRTPDETAGAAAGSVTAPTEATEAALKQAAFDVAQWQARARLAEAGAEAWYNHCLRLEALDQGMPDCDPGCNSPCHLALEVALGEIARLNQLLDATRLTRNSAEAMFGAFKSIAATQRAEIQRLSAALADHPDEWAVQVGDEEPELTIRGAPSRDAALVAAAGWAHWYPDSQLRAVHRRGPSRWQPVADS